MDSNLELVLDDASITFTSSGKMHLMEAISALSGAGSPEKMWEALKEKNPEIDQYVEYVGFSEKRDVPVTDSRGWENIQALLFEHILDISE